MQHEIDAVFGTDHRLQSWAGPSEAKSSVMQNKQPCDDPCTDVAEGILRCTTDLLPPKVKRFTTRT